MMTFLGWSLGFALVGRIFGNMFFSINYKHQIVCTSEKSPVDKSLGRFPTTPPKIPQNNTPDPPELLMLEVMTSSILACQKPYVQKNP